MYFVEWYEVGVSAVGSNEGEGVELFMYVFY
jgi:hypothetical protein